jgi:hypothetical protein
MQDLGYELPRIPIPRTPVHKGKKKGRSYDAPALLTPLVWGAGHHLIRSGLGCERLLP